jgi:tetratricopeptide (TPR) repeat protein
MAKTPQDPQAGYYDPLLDEHGEGPRAVGWKTPHDQLLHFIDLCAVDGLESGVSVLDIGCGLGDLKTYLDGRGLEVEYTGYDVNARMLEGARRRHPNATFEQRDIVSDPPDRTFDIVIGCGVFNLLLPNHERWLEDMLLAMFKVCQRAVSFSLLSAYAVADDPQVERDAKHYFAWPETWLRFCRMLSPQVNLRHDTNPNYFVTHVYRRNDAPVRRLTAALRPGKTWDESNRAIVQQYQELGLWEELRAYLDTLEPSAPVWNHIGIAESYVGDPAAERAAYEQAATLDPKLAWPHLNLGNLHKREGHFAEACQSLEHALSLDPTNQVALESLLGVLVSLERFDDAQALVPKLTTEAARGYWRARILRDSGEPASAIEELEKILADAPRFVSAMVCLAELYVGADKHEQARAWYRKAYATAPTNRQILLRLYELEKAR